MLCVICNGVLDGEVSVVKKLGLKTLKKFSELRKDGLLDLFQSVEEVSLHTYCRKKYCTENAKGIYKPLPRLSGHSSPSVATAGPCDGASASYQFQEKCFYCDQQIQEKLKNICTVRSEQTKSTIIRALSKVPSDKNETVIRRIKDVDLKKEMARYHRKCYLDNLHPRTGLKRGRPEDSDVTAAMEIIFKHIDVSSDPQFTLQDLKCLVNDYVPDDRTIIGKLQKKYRNKIIISQSFGKTIITFREKTEEILAQNCHLQQKDSNLAEEKFKIVKQAADIIREDIRRLNVLEKNVCPTHFCFVNVKDDIPRSLDLFLKTLAGNQTETEVLKKKLLTLARAK